MAGYAFVYDAECQRGWMHDESIGFADRVRIRETPLTAEKGLAGRVGVIHGWTVPSSTGVEVIGAVENDYALNVHFEEHDDSLWFSEDLLEFVDHGAGTTVSLTGSDTTWVRTESGAWEVRPG